MNIFVGNLSYSTNEDSVRTLFEQHGEVTSVRMVTDRQTGRPRGFAFVEMPNDEEARAAITAINGTEVDGRALKVDEARERTERRGGDRPRRDERW
jgi:RNA recognition motif-containing protein